MIRLARTTERLQAVLAGAVTANQLQCTVGFFDLIASTGQFITLETVRGGRKNQTTNNTTDVNICDGPAAQGTLRSIDYVKIYNADTASATVIVKTDDATTESIHIRVTLATLETLYYEDKEGWYCTDANGNRKVATTAVNSSAVLGTTTNDSAAAGRLGEIIESTVLSGSSISLTTTVIADITSITLTPGDWNVWGNIVTNPNAGTTTSLVWGWVHTTSATLPTPPNAGAEMLYQSALAGGAGLMMPIGQRRYSVSSNTTVYLSIRVDFAVSTMNAYGYIGARRAR